MIDEAVFTETRLALQSVAEHVLSAARYQATGRIGLRASPGGFTTPPFPSDHGERTLAVDGRELVATDERGAERMRLTTVHDAAVLAEISPGAPTEVYAPTTPLVPDAVLAVDDAVAAVFADWWALVDAALAAFSAEHPAEEPAQAQLWPEHFDLATSVGEVNYGGSPGDAGHELPYLYVGPWSPPEPDGTYWNRPFGALVPATDITDVDTALAFFRKGRARLA
jgi:hypothetical protein